MLGSMPPKQLNHAQTIEKWIFICWLTLTGFLLAAGFFWGSWAWWLCAALFLVYLSWWSLRLILLYRWLKDRTQHLSAPKVSGLLKSPVDQLLHERQQTERIHDKNKELIRQFRTMVEALPYATLLINKTVTIKYLNERAEQMFGLSQSDVGQPLAHVFGQSDVLQLFDTDYFTSEKAAKEGLKMAHPTAANRLIKVRLIKANQHRSLLLAHDISAMEALQKSRKNFMANASHELRTPLTVITGYLEFLQNHSKDVPSIKQAVDQAYDQSQRMSQIIADMLTLSRIEHDSVLAGEDEQIDMPGLLNRLFRDVRHGVDARQHHFSAQIDSTLWLKGNASEITGVCLNLLHNAVLHTPPGTHIELHWFDRSGRACLQVKDNGPGIAAKHLPHVTERFYRVADSARQQQGSTGLGLAIVKHIGLKHSAELHIDSAPDKGSCFTMLFPLNRSLVNR